MPKTLLLADDSVTIQKVVGLSFANEDVSLVTVDNGDDAIARARSLRPDVVLADVVMPGKNGYEVCEAIKGDPALRHIPVLLLTGTFEAFDEERARRVGADGHITKPFEAQALVDTVNGLLARAVTAPPMALSQAITAPTPAPPQAAPAASAPPTVVAAPAAPIPVGEESYDFFDDDVMSSDSLAADTAVAVAGAPPGAAQATVLAEADAFDLGVEESGLELAEVEADLPAPAAARGGASPDATVAMFTGAPAAPAPRPAVSLDEELGALELAEPAAEAVSADDLFEREGMFEPEVAPASASFADLAEPPSASPVEIGDGLDAAFDLGLDEAPALAASEALERDPLAGFDTEARAPGLEPVSSRDFDVSWSDLGRPIGGPDLDARLGGGDTVDPADSGVPTVGILDHTPTAPSAPLAMTELPSLPPVAEPVQPVVVSAPPISRTEPILVETSPTVSTGFAAAPLPEPSAMAAPIAAPAPIPAAAASARAPGPDLSPVMRQRIHDMLEKVAWEAFSDLSDTIVRQALERIEAIAWEVIPQMAEALVREEIRRMKGEDE
jgi:CheY-like chemotaxis protein